MSTRPSAVNNDPGYFYDPRKSMVLFALTGAALMASLVWMILADWDRPWKDDQRAELLWSSNAAGVQAIVLDEQTAALLRQLEGEGAAAHKALDEKAEELEGLRKRIAQAEGDHYRADKTYKEQRQVTGEAEWHVHESKNEAARSDWTLRYEQALDHEKRLHAVEQEANRRLNALLAEEKEALQVIDAVFEKRQKNAGLKRLRLLRDARRRTASYNPLREVPLMDIVPPTTVEQVVLDSIRDDYEFASPKKVDRCATCHFGVFRTGFEAETWPVEALALPAGDVKKVAAFERGVYLLVFDLFKGIEPKPDKQDPLAYDKGLARLLKVHLRTLSFLFVMEDEEEGIITLDDRGRKVWRRFNQDAEGHWKEAAEGEPGHSLADFYLASLRKFRKHWETHPHSHFMVGAGSPHDYETTGCTVCHQGRGWSTDFGRAYHTPDLVEVDDWLSDERVAREGWKLPLSARMGFSAAVQSAHAGPDPAHVGYVTDRDAEKRWKQELGRSKGKLKYWAWPQLPKSLVQASCLKCHKEGLYYPPGPEYPHTTFGKPLPLPTELEDALLIYGDQRETWRNREVAKEADRMLIPAGAEGENEPYRAESLLRGMDGFLRFGCYGCHKLDPKIYPFMNEVRPKVGPPLDTIATKTTEKWVRQQIWNPKNFRPDTRMPRFLGQSNSSHDFRYRFADPDTEFDEVNGHMWGQGEVYAMARWVWTEAQKRSPQHPAVDLSKGDPKRGQQLIVADANTSGGRAKACIACHDIPIQDEALQYDPAVLESWVDPRTGRVYGWGERMSRRFGPNLAGIGSKIRAEWLVAWLQDPKGLWHDSVMPNLRLTGQDALDIASYLMTLRNEEFEALPEVVGNQGFILKMAEELKVAEQSMPIPQAVAEAQLMTPTERTLYVGKKLVKHYGCFGCHDIEAYKKETPIGTELTDWGSKLIERLEFNHFPIDHHRADFPVARFSFAYAKLRNPRIFDLGMPRADRPYDRLKMGNFGFSAQEARDIATFLVALVNDPVETEAAFHLSERDQLIWKGRQLVRNANCQACHVIEGAGGDVWQTITKDKWRPPDLRGQGLKTRPDWLFKFLQGPFTIRPWFSIHMPTFGFTEEQNRAAVAYFAALSEVPYPFEYRSPSSLVDADGKPIPLPAPKKVKLKDPDDPEKHVFVTVSDRLEEARMMFRAFSCKSCHSTDPSVPLGNRAPNFLLTREGRLRVPWMRKWLWNPSKLQVGTAMPAFYTKKGEPTDKQFFGGDSAEQIRALADFVRYHYKESDR